ncbi:hypothetical protein ABPG74_000398 [Tetrahymena malaccensis]
MEQKQLSIINTAVDLNKTSLNKNYFSLIDKTQFIKQSEVIIDTDYMIIIKSQLEQNFYLGNIRTVDDTSVHCFSSQNGVYWHLNLLNSPFNVYNISTNQVIQDAILESNNKIAIYDKITKSLMILDILKQPEEKLSIKFNQEFNLSVKIIDWNVGIFFWIQNMTVYLIDQLNNQIPKIISQLDSQIVDYKYCFNQQFIAVKTVKLSIYIIQIKSTQKTKVQYYYYNSFSDIQFYLMCDQNLLVIYFPSLQIFDLLTGKLSEDFPNQDNFGILSNKLQSTPLIDKNNQLIVYLYHPAQSYFQFNQTEYLDYIFDYRFNNTLLFYDMNYQILLGLTGTIKQINIINIPGTNKLFTYETVSYFSKEMIYYYQEQNSLIVVDQTPILYLCKYKTQNITIQKIEIKNIQGMLMDQNKNMVFIYSDIFISTYLFPSLQFQESISLQQYGLTPIQKVYLNQIQSILFVQTQSYIIAFDLTEVLYGDEINLLQYQNIQPVFLDYQHQVYSSIINNSLNLYKNSELVDTLLLEPQNLNVYPYFTQPILIQSNQFIYIQYNILNVIHFDLQNQKLIRKFKILLLNTPDNYFYDNIRNQMFLLYEKSYLLNQINLQTDLPQESYSTNFQQGEIQQSLIFNDFIILPSSNTIQIYNYIIKQHKLVTLINGQQIYFSFKLLKKQFEDYQNFWWNIPFEYEERYNTNDFNEQGQSLICLVSKLQNQYSIQILDVLQANILQSQIFQYIKINNIVNDPFRQVLYVINNIGTTQILNYSLSQIATLTNSCLKQALIGYDSNFIYSICPYDVIIYNGLNFQQQFPKINQGIRKVLNFINIQQTNYFIVVQKELISIIKVDFQNNYELIQEIRQMYPVVQKIQTVQSQSLVYMNLTLSSYTGIIHSTIPLISNSNGNQNCFINIQQQNRELEYIYTQIALNQIFYSLQSSNQVLSQIQIDYQDQQQIQELYINFLEANSDNFNDTLVIILQSNQQQNNIFWFNNTANALEYIINLIIRQMSLFIVDSIQLNQNDIINHFQMINVTLNIGDSLKLSNFETVLFQNIKYYQKQGNNQIIIENCQFVIIENILIDEVLSKNVLFTFNNNNHVILKQIYIQNSNSNNIFQLFNNQILEIQDIFINQSNDLSIFKILLGNSLKVNNIYIKNVQSSSVLQIQGTLDLKIQQIQVNECNQILLIEINALEIQNQKYLQMQNEIRNFNISNSTDIMLFIQSVTTRIFNFQFNHLNNTQNCTFITTNNLVMDNVTVQNSQSNYNSFIQIFDFTNCTIQHIYSFNNDLQMISLNNQNIGGFAYILNSEFANCNLQQNNNLLTYSSSTIIIMQCETINLNSLQLKNNTNINGAGGSIYAFESYNIIIKNSIFIQNKCLSFQGGALFISNLKSLSLLEIYDSIFLQNQALASTGGAVSVQNTNIIMKNTEITQNRAAIGGGVYYDQTIPQFVLDINKGLNNNNTIKNNQAVLYGKNLGSSLRKICINIDNIYIPKESAIEQEINNFKISQFKSGQRISINKIQLLDEEDNPLFIPNIDEPYFNKLTSDIQSLIKQIIISFKWDQQNYQIQLEGQLQSQQFINDGFNLNAQLMYQPQKNMVLQIVSNTFQQLLDSQGNIVIQGGYLQQNVTIEFTNCSIGEIQKNQGNSILCNQCPDGKYSLSTEDIDCKQCPIGAISCISSVINLKNGYWRENEESDQIAYCGYNPESCQSQSMNSKYGCIEGYIGTLCQSCDIYGQIWNERYSEIFKPGRCYKCEESTFLILVQNFMIFLLISSYIFYILKNIVSKLQSQLAGYYIQRLDMIYLGSTRKYQI